MASWFKTRKEAYKELEKRKEKNPYSCGDKVWRWRHTKRKKPFFVGDYIEWLNI